MSKQSKYESCRKHLLRGWKLTPLQALNKFGVFRLAVVVNRMRKERIKIDTDLSRGFAVYKLKKS